MNTTPKKKVHLDLVGLDGNAFNLLGRFRRQAHNEGWTWAEIDAVLTEAKSGDYNHLLATLMDHCQAPNVDDEPVDTIYERAALAIQAAERALATIRSLLADPAVHGWSEDERISIHAGLSSLAEEATEIMNDVPAPIEDDPETGGQ